PESSPDQFSIESMCIVVCMRSRYCCMCIFHNRNLFKSINCLLFRIIQAYGLEQVKTRKYKYPNQVNEVPVQTCFFNHQVMASSVKRAIPGHDEHDNVDHYTGEYVKSVETGDGKEEV